MIPLTLLEQMARADSLALQARAAALAGDHKRAADLRSEMDSIYAQLEAQAKGMQPVSILSASAA